MEIVSDKYGGLASRLSEYLGRDRIAYGERLWAEFFSARHVRPSVVVAAIDDVDLPRGKQDAR
jgi:hypothetical protein